MLLTDENQIVLHRDSIRRVADLLNINTSERSLETLLIAIRNRDESAWVSLTRFLNAWDEWYEFHRRIEGNGHTGRLTPEESRRLASLVAARNRTRTALILKTRQLELRRVTIRVPPNELHPGEELELAARIRLDLYSHGPIEIDPDAEDFSTRRDDEGCAFFSFTTAHADLVRNLLDRFDYTPHVEISVEQVDGAETCLNCGTVYSQGMPAVCENCNFRDISPCPNCNEDIPRAEYIKRDENLFICPTCAATVRLRFNDPLIGPDDQYTQPLVIVEDSLG